MVTSVMRHPTERSDSGSCSQTSPYENGRGDKIWSFILLFDIVLSLAGCVGLVLPECSCCSRLAGMWAWGSKVGCPPCFTSLLTEGKPEAVLGRLVALLASFPCV
ncbi:hypothetical protein INR49_006407 [Caranx melampygus]|nr:hypothetical protein INR49_006407 [Caranx melampygus]